MKIPLIVVMDSRRAQKREDICFDLSSCRACGGTSVRTKPTKILNGQFVGPFASTLEKPTETLTER